MKNLTVTFFLFFFLTIAYANQSHYHGQENRKLKSLSNEDITALEEGAGWGLAKPAELNGIPGPAHLLELKEELGLDEQQIKKINAIWSEMNTEAKRYGKHYLEAEAKIENFFRQKTQTLLDTDLATLERLLMDSSNYLAKLRNVHLIAHLKTKPLLSNQQINQYSSLRGYHSSEQHHGHKSHHGHKPNQ